MSVIEFVDVGSPPVDDWIEGDDWHAALCIAWAQITEGSAECEACGEPARAVIATGADPDYSPVCWKHAAQMVLASVDLGASLFGENE